MVLRVLLYFILGVYHKTSYTEFGYIRRRRRTLSLPLSLSHATYYASNPHHGSTTS